MTSFLIQLINTDQFYPATNKNYSGSAPKQKSQAYIQNFSDKQNFQLKESNSKVEAGPGKINGEIAAVIIL
jgi:hypothetical protein